MAKTPTSRAPSAKSIGANESNASLKKLMKMGANPTLVAKGQGVRQP